MQIMTQVKRVRRGRSGGVSVQYQTRGVVCVISLFLGVSRNLLVFPTTSSDRNVPECSAFGPVSATGLAEVARLGEGVVVVVAKLGVG